MFRFIFLFAILLSALSETGNAARRALVIGNDAYLEIEPLQKAVNDARAVAERLEDLGFDVDARFNLDERTATRAVSAFARSLSPGDTAFFFYAGHGLEIDGENHLLPVDVPAPGPGEKRLIQRESLPLSRVLRDIRDSGANLTIAIIDACRDNPFANRGTRGIGASRGLAMTPPPQGTFIIYSAGQDQTALDRLSNNDPNPNSVFTRKLLPLLLEPGLSLPELARRLRRQVTTLAETVNHPQRPAYYDEMLGNFVFSAARSERERLRPLGEAGAGPASSLQGSVDGEDSRVQEYVDPNAIPEEPTTITPTRTRDPAVRERELGMTLDDRKTVQAVLSRLGFDTRGVDGVFGRRTRLAIASWQQTRGLPATGYIDDSAWREIVSQEEVEALTNPLDAAADDTQTSSETVGRADPNQNGEKPHSSPLEFYPDAAETSKDGPESGSYYIVAKPGVSVYIRSAPSADASAVRSFSGQYVASVHKKNPGKWLEIHYGSFIRYIDWAQIEELVDVGSSRGIQMTQDGALLSKPEYAAVCKSGFNKMEIMRGFKTYAEAESETGGFFFCGDPWITLISGNCIALAVSPENAWSARVKGTVDHAKAEAIKACDKWDRGGCTIREAFCSQ